MNAVQMPIDLRPNV